MDAFEVIGLRFDLVLTMWIIIGGFALAVMLFSIGAIMDNKSRYGDGGLYYLIASGVAVITGIVGVIWILMFIPFKSEYHHWYSTTGEVVSITNVFEGGSGEVSPGYVVELDSVEQPLVFDDPRILSKQGQELSVSCSLEWVPAGADRLNCWIAG